MRHVLKGFPDILLTGQTSMDSPGQLQINIIPGYLNPGRSQLIKLSVLILQNAYIQRTSAPVKHRHI